MAELQQLNQRLIKYNKYNTKSVQANNYLPRLRIDIMKSLELKNPYHISLVIDFGKWLKTLGYAKGSQYNLPSHLQEFLNWLEVNEVTLESLTTQQIKSYYEHLKRRKNRRKAYSGLRVNYLQKHVNALETFGRYLKLKHGLEKDFFLHLKRPERKELEVLTKDEINRLYAVCGDSITGLRDRVLLALYYGCGLRKNEGVKLNIQDILHHSNLVYVRYGKGFKERKVPMSVGVVEHIESYLKESRPYLLKNNEENALILSKYGVRMSAVSVYGRIQELKKRAEIHKPVGVHLLRHSIATHLLQSGMSLEQIALFLGHSSLESTQVYTRIKL